MIYARIKDGQLVTAKVIHDSAGKHDADAETPTVPAGWNLVADTVTANEVSDQGFPELTRRQLRLALLKLGITSATVEQVIAQIPDEGQREAAMIYWQDSLSYSREHTLVNQIAAALSIPEQQLNSEWMLAITLDEDS